MKNPTSVFFLQLHKPRKYFCWRKTLKDERDILLEYFGHIYSRHICLISNINWFTIYTHLYSLSLPVKKIRKTNAWFLDCKTWSTVASFVLICKIRLYLYSTYIIHDMEVASQRLPSSFVIWLCKYLHILLFCKAGGDKERTNERSNESGM